MTDKKNHTDVLLEDMNGKIDLILEAVGSMQDHVKKIPKMAERLEEIEHDITSIKLDTSITRHDEGLIKIRTEKLEEIQDEVKNLQKRVKILESV